MEILKKVLYMVILDLAIYWSMSMGLTGIIDWELAHIGNPIQDLGWMCGNSWRFGNYKMVVGGFGEIEDLIEGYNGVSEEKINAELIKTWQVFGTYRWGVICPNASVCSYKRQCEFH